MSEDAKFADEDVLIVVDVQIDFCPGGALAVPRGDEVIPIVNGLAARFRNVVLTQDWHPRGHASFASSHPGKKPFETVSAFYGPQVLWPDHCVQGTPGARFHPALPASHAALVSRKGFRPAIDSYSGLLRKRPQDPDRPRRLSARAPAHAHLPRRPRLRLLRALFGRGCPTRGLCRLRSRGCMPRHRSRWLGGGHTRKPRGARGAVSARARILRNSNILTFGSGFRFAAMQRNCVRRTNFLDFMAKDGRKSQKIQVRFAMPHQAAAPASRLPSLMMPCPVCAGRMAYRDHHLIAPDVEDTVYACQRCGAELIRTSVCAAKRVATAA